MASGSFTIARAFCCRSASGRRAAAGELHPSPPDVTNAASIFGQGDRGIVTGGAERAEERHVGVVERLSAGELPARRSVGAQAIDVLPDLPAGPHRDERVPAGGDSGTAARGRAASIGVPDPVLTWEVTQSQLPLLEEPERRCGAIGSAARASNGLPQAKVMGLSSAVSNSLAELPAN